MGPIALFDKSFIQSLSEEESLWFDHFFLSSVCPLFYAETLADISKQPRPGKSPEGEVEIIASKFPDLHGTPCHYHVHVWAAELDGYLIPMNGSIPFPDGRSVSVGDTKAAVWMPMPLN